MLVIAGVDPGTTTGVSILTLDGAVQATRSRKEFGLDEVTRYIISQGKPLIIATDVTPAPSTVAKLASTLGATRYEPQSDLGTDEKEDLIAAHDTAGMDEHAKDALAAAYKAYNEYSELIDRVQEEARGQDVEDIEGVVRDVVSGSMSVQQAIEAQQDDRERKNDTGNSTAPEVDWEAKAEEYRERLKRKERENERLRSYVQELKEERDSLQEQHQRLKEEKHRELRKDRTVQRWKQKAENARAMRNSVKEEKEELATTLDRYRSLVEAVRSGSDLFRICTTEEELASVEGDIAFVARNLHADPPANVTTVVVEKQEDAELYAEKGVRTVPLAILDGVRAEELYAVPAATIRKRAETDHEAFLEWLDAYRDRND